MKKLLMVILLPFMLSGCIGDPPKPDPVIKPVIVQKPVLYCPAPPTFTSPRLVTDDLVPTDVSDPGRVAQFYKAVVIQLIGEIQSRDAVINAYHAIQNTNPDLQQVDVNKIFNDTIKSQNMQQKE